jgi:hypothetical protein
MFRSGVAKYINMETPQQWVLCVYLSLSFNFKSTNIYKMETWY